MGFLFNTIVSAAIGFTVTAVAVGTGPVGLAVLIIKGAEIGVGAYAAGAIAGVAANKALNLVSNPGPKIDFLYDTVVSARDKVKAEDVAPLVPSPNSTKKALNLVKNPEPKIDLLKNAVKSAGDKIRVRDVAPVVAPTLSTNPTSLAPNLDNSSSLLKILNENSNNIIGVVVFFGLLAYLYYSSSESKKDSEHSNSATTKTKASDSGENSKRRNVSSGSRDGKDVSSAGAPNDPDRNPNDKKRTCGSEDSSDLDDSEANDFESSDANDIRNHRYKYLDKNFPSRSKYDQPLEVDHIIPMAVWRQLHAILIRSQKNLNEHLIRLKKIFEIILRSRNILELTDKDIKNMSREFPVMEILKSIHRAQSTTGNTNRQQQFNESMIQSILQGKWDEAIISVFKDQHELARLNNVSAEERALIRKRQRSLVRYCLRKQIITCEEATNIFMFIKNTKN